MNQPFEGIEISGQKDISKLEKFIEETLDYHNTPSEYFGNILLAVTETAEMMIKNSEESVSLSIGINRSTKGILVKINQNRETGKPVLEIIDMALNKENLVRETFMIQTLVDEIVVGKKGDSIVLQFEINGISFERALNRSERVRKYLKTGVKVVDTNEH